jgi:hypothetical protein
MFNLSGWKRRVKGVKRGRVRGRKGEAYGWRKVKGGGGEKMES